MSPNTLQGNLEILQEDEHLIVCRKPAGLPVQTAKFAQQDMISVLKNYRARRKELPEIYVVHRLDQPVEGVMVFAKTQKAASILSKQIQQKSVDKYYRAIVEGIPNPRKGELEDYLLREGRTNTSRVVKRDTPGAKKARLCYKVITSKAMLETGCSLLEIQLETGRHHQIRVQLAHAGHPLVGDKKYNPRCQEGYLSIGLCSTRLAFFHPATGKRMEYDIEPVGEAFWLFESNNIT